MKQSKQNNKQLAEELVKDLIEVWSIMKQNRVRVTLELDELGHCDIISCHRILNVDMAQANSVVDDLEKHLKKLTG